jgi:molybdopterin/thiamine biosynthesis adenylyltransferase
MDKLSGKQYIRYERHIELPEIGEYGQNKLLNSSILIIGAGGLGTPAAAYLAAGGIGKLGIIDDDVVSRGNLQRQFLYKDTDENKSKVACLCARLREANPEIELEPLNVRLIRGNADDIISDYDLVLDGSDNFETKYLANEVCHRQKKPLVYGAVLGFDGQVSVFKSYERDQPCYKCLYADVPEHLVPSCTESAVLGPMVGIIGALQAAEAIKVLLNLPCLAGSLLFYNALNAHIAKAGITKRSNCAICAKDA